MRIWILVFFLLSVSAVTAEINGTINNSAYNFSAPVSGLFGYTVQYCDIKEQCFGYRCFVDYDGEVDDSATGNPAGICNMTSITSCFHDSKWYVSGTNLCNTNVTYRSCLTNETGNWSGVFNCASGETCSPIDGPGNCTAAAAASSSSSGGGASTATTSISVTPPAEIRITQGGTNSSNIVVKNTGTRVVRNVKISLSGISSTWFNAVAAVASLAAGQNTTFSVTFSIPADAESKGYTVTVSGISDEANATATTTLNVLPGEEAKKGINETYISYSLLLADLESNFSSLGENANKEDVAAIESLIANARNKLIQANESMAGGDYFAANTLLSEAKSIMDEIGTRLENVRYESPEPLLPISADQTTLLIIGAIIAVVAAVIAVLKLRKPRGKTDITKYFGGGKG